MNTPEHLQLNSLQGVRVGRLTPRWRMGVWRKLRAAFENDPDPLENISLEWSRIALRGKRMLGCAIVTNERYLQYLYVNQDMQRKGIGSTLLRDCVDDIESLHCEAHLVHFYQRFGRFQMSEMADGRHYLVREQHR
jgi:GNAT superfamily N-acetyltransferase